MRVLLHPIHVYTIAGPDILRLALHVYVYQWCFSLYIAILLGAYYILLAITPTGTMSCILQLKIALCASGGHSICGTSCTLK